MIIREIKLLSEGLWESIKSDLKFFAPIQHFVKILSEYDYSNIHQEDMDELILNVTKVKNFFDSYIPESGEMLVVFDEIGNNINSAHRIFHLVNQLPFLTEEQLNKEIDSVKLKAKRISRGKGFIFIGHGRSKLWARLQIYLQDELNLKTLSFETESHTSESIINILEGFLDKASYAILVMTAEDITENGSIRARQNVIHEAGLFQGRLGFDKVVLLKQDTTEEFSNVAGLQYIPFKEENIEQTFYELNRALKKAGLIK